MVKSTKRHKHEGEKMCGQPSTQSQDVQVITPVEVKSTASGFLEQAMLTLRVLLAWNFKLIVLGNHVFRKGSHGVKDVSDDVDELSEQLESTVEPSLAIPTGESNSLVVLELVIINDKTGKRIVDGVASLANFLRGMGLNPQVEITRALKTCIGNMKFHLYFFCTENFPYTRLAIMPGVNLYGQNGHVDAAGTSFVSFNKRYTCELASGDSIMEIDPDNNPFDGLECMPMWMLELAKQESPFYAVSKGRVSENRVIEACANGVNGPNAELRFHDYLCQLRGLGVEHEVYFDTIKACATSSQLNEEWALEYGRYVWYNYKPVKFITEAERGKKALEASLEF